MVVLEKDRTAAKPVQVSSRGLSLLCNLVICITVCIGGVPSATQAREATSATTSQKRLRFDIPAGTLDSALSRFGQQSGLLISVDSALTSGLTSNELQGEYTARQALQRLLVGSGLDYRFIDDRTVTLMAARQEGPPLALSPILVVTGTKQGLSVQDTQTSVELFDEERIERDVLFSLDDVLQRTPNVSMQNVQTGYSIRGIGQDGVGFAGTGRTSTVYVDGVPLSFDSEQGQQSLWDVQQVEILRGPQSTVQGRNALAGAVVIKTNDPTYQWESRARLLAGTQDTRRASGVVSGPIVADQVAFRLAYDYQTYDGDVAEATTGIRQEFQDSRTLRGKLLIEPDAFPDLSVKLTLEHVDTDFGEFNTIFAPVSFTDPSFSDFDPFGGNTHTRVRLEEPETDKVVADIAYDLNDHWQLISVSTYEDHDRARVFGIPAGGDVRLDSSPAETETLSTELRLAFDYDRLSGWVGGYYYDSERSETSNFTAAPDDFGFPSVPAGATVTLTSERTTETENYAVFGDLTYELNDSWALTAGARYDEEKFSDSGNQGSVSADPANCTIPSFGDSPCTILFGANNQPGQPADFSAFLPRVGIIHNFDGRRSLSFGVQRGYRAGGSVVRLVPDLGISELVSFDPEYVTNYELAFRSQWLGDRLTFNANAFYTKWTDQQVTVSGPSGLPLDSVVVNAGESKLYGLELSSSFQASSSLDLFASLGLLRTEFTDFPFAQMTGEFENLAGNEFPTAPQTTAAAGINYDHPSGAYTSWNVSYRSSQFSDVTNLKVNKVSSYTLVNARVGYRSSGLDIYAYANNLFDKRVATSKTFATVNTGTGEVTPNGNARFQVNEPRQLGIAMEYRF